MNEIQVDVDLEEKLLKAILEAHGYGDITAITPMHEVRTMAEAAGRMFGRVIAMVAYSGPITSEVVELIRESEERNKERFLNSVQRLMRPGGELRLFLENKTGLDK